MVRVKICGITRKIDAYKASDYGAHALGFICYNKSPRYIKPSKIASIMVQMPPFIQGVAVFVNASKEHILSTMQESRLDSVQLHGDESPDFCQELQQYYPIIKAFRIASLDDIKAIKPYCKHVSAILLEGKTEKGYGGTGQCMDWSLALQATSSYRCPLILAGGLTSNNVAEAINHVQPYAVDTSSGVELEAGKKDVALLRAFMGAVGS